MVYSGTEGLAESRADVASENRRGRGVRRTESLWLLNVLTVDDDEADSFLIGDALRSNLCVRSVKHYSHPDEAIIDLAKGRARPDLIFLDISMPKMNGFTFLRALADIPWQRNVPVVLLTTSNYAKDVERAKDHNILNYIVKPNSVEKLHDLLASVINQLVVGE